VGDRDEGTHGAERMLRGENASEGLQEEDGRKRPEKTKHHTKKKKNKKKKKEG